MKLKQHYLLKTKEGKVVGTFHYVLTAKRFKPALEEVHGELKLEIVTK